jgi:hypothetical protein
VLGGGGILAGNLLGMDVGGTISRAFNKVTGLGGPAGPSSTMNKFDMGHQYGGLSPAVRGEYSEHLLREQARSNQLQDLMHQMRAAYAPLPNRYLQGGGGQF